MYYTPKIIFEDEHIIVVDKPAGLIVNRADTSRHVETLQDFVEPKIADLKSADEASEFKSRGGIVHRLDKETSGLLVIARNEHAFIEVKSQFLEKTVRKVYIALVHGKIIPKMGEVEVPIGRLPWNRTRFGVLPEGRESKTLYEVTEYRSLVQAKENGELSLLRVYPMTGRTHQIRVHMRHLGHPIFADELYAGRKQSKRDRKLLSRHFLHATEISFKHPLLGKVLKFESELPEDLSLFLEKHTTSVDFGA